MGPAEFGSGASFFVATPKVHKTEIRRLELTLSHMAQKPVLWGEVGCACVAREVSVDGEII